MAPLTLAGAGTLALKAALGVNLDPVVALSASTNKISGQLAASLAALSSAATGAVKIQAAAAPTLAGVAIAATAGLVIKADAAPSLGALTLSAASTIATPGPIVTNGTFTTDTAWTKTGGASTTISGGVLNFTAGTGKSAYQVTATTLVAGHTYRVEYDQVRTTGGTAISLGLAAGGSEGGQTATYSSTGHKSEDIILADASATTITISTGTTGVMTVDNVVITDLG